METLTVFISKYPFEGANFYKITAELWLINSVDL